MSSTAERALGVASSHAEPAPPASGDAWTGGLLAEVMGGPRSRVAAFVSLGQTLDAQLRMGIGLGHEEAFAKLDPEVRRQAEREISVQRLLRFSGAAFDVKQLTDELEHLADPAQRAAVLKEYELRSGHSLRSELHAHSDADSYHRAATDQLLSDDRARAEEQLAALAHDDPKAYQARRKQAEEVARRLVSELSKSDPDKKLVIASINFTDSAEDIELIRQAFRAIAPEQDGLFNRLNDALAGKDERQAIAALDMGPKRRLKQAAATLRNYSADFARDARETLGRLTPAEIQEMTDHPAEYGDIIAEVRGWDVTPGDRRIIDAIVAGQRDLAAGLQLAEDIAGGYVGETWAAPRLTPDGHLDDPALFAKLEALKPEERERAIAAYDAAGAGTGRPSLRALMEQRFHRDKDNYDRDRGVALLEGRVEDAMAALAMDAIDRKGTHLDDLEHALSDPGLDPRRAQGGDGDPAAVQAHQAALARRARIEQAFARYGKGTLRDLAGDEDKLAAGKDDRVAFDELLATGALGFAVKMQRAIDAGETAKAKELMLAASDEDLARARAIFPGLEAGQGFDERVRLTWGDDTGTTIQMAAVLEKGARQGWSPLERARVNRAAHDADREDGNGSWAGSHYDYAIRREEAAAAAGLSGEELAFHTDNADAAATAYGKQKQAETEAFINHLKLAVTLVAAVLAPELLVVLAPLLSAASIGYKEAKLGRHYEGEQSDLHGLAIDVALSLASVAGEALIAARQASLAREVEAAGGETVAVAEKVAHAQRLKLDAVRIAADSAARGVADGKGWDEIMKDVALGELQLGASRATAKLLGGFLQKIEGGGLLGRLGKASLMAGAQAATSVPFDAAMSGSHDFLRMFLERAANEGASGAHGAIAERRFAGTTARQAREALAHLPGAAHFEGIIPDDWPPVPGCLRHSDAEELLHTYALLGATPTGQQALRTIAERHVNVTMERGAGTFYAEESPPRINLDRDTDPTAYHMAGATPHEAHHAATLARDVNARTQGRGEYRQAYLRNEAEAQAALFEHHREAAMLLGVDHGRGEGGHAEYHTAHAQVVAAHAASGEPPEVVRARAHEAGVRRLREWFATAVPSDSLMTDEHGRRVPRPGAPRTYDERSAREWDEEQAMRAVGNLLASEPAAPRRMAAPRSPLPPDFSRFGREEQLARLAATADPSERLAMWKEAHKIHSFDRREESLARTAADPELSADEKTRRGVATRNIWGHTLVEIDDEAAHLEKTWGHLGDAEKHRLLDEVMARKQLELEIEMRHNVSIRNDIDQKHSGTSILHRPSERRTWSLGELEMIDVSLGRLPPEHILGNRLLPPMMLNGVANPRTAGLQLRRAAMDHRWVAAEDGVSGRWSPRPATMGDHLDGVVTAYDLAFTAPFHSEVDPLGGHVAGGPPGHGPVGLFESNLVHEIGHGVEFGHGAKGTDLASAPGSASEAFRQAGGWSDTHFSRDELLRRLSPPLSLKAARKEAARLDKHRDSFNPVPTTREASGGGVYQVDKYHAGDYLGRARGALPESAEDPLHRWDYARKHPAEAFAEQYQMAVHTPTQYHEDMVEAPARMITACEAQLRDAKEALQAAGGARQRKRAEAQVTAAETELEEARAAATARGRQREVLREQIFHTPAAVAEHKAVLEALPVTTPIAKIGRAWRIATFEKEAAVAMTPHQVAALAEQAASDIELLP